MSAITFLYKLCFYINICCILFETGLSLLILLLLPTLPFLHTNTFISKGVFHETAILAIEPFLGYFGQYSIVHAQKRSHVSSH